MTTPSSVETTAPAKIRDRLRRLRIPLSSLIQPRTQLQPNASSLPATTQTTSPKPPSSSSAALLPRQTDINPEFRVDLDPDLLSKLAYAFGSTAFEPRFSWQDKGCLEGTRVDVLNQIALWAEDPHGAPLFWLTGAVGVGKSTICRTVAESLRERGQLGATFIFRREEGDSCNVRRFCATVAAELAIRVPGLARFVAKAVEADPAISEKAADIQFEKLVFQPLAKLTSASTAALTLVVVINALDECGGDREVRTILRLLATAKDTKPVRLRVFATSGTELADRLNSAGNPRWKHQYLTGLIRVEIPERATTQDIFTYLRHEFSTIRLQHSQARPEHQLLLEWPGDVVTQALVKLSTPSFSVAATISRFVADPSGDPEKRLKALLGYQAGGSGSNVSQIYHLLLNQLLNNSSDGVGENTIAGFREIIGPIMCLANPLPPTSLAELLDISTEDIMSKLDKLHTFFRVPTNKNDLLRPWHRSFRNFVLDPATSGNSLFSVDGTYIHNKLAIKCLELLSRPGYLRENMCNLSNPGTLRREIAKRTIFDNVPAHVQYACRYWVYHLEQGQGDIGNRDQVYNFLKEHLLHWLEILSLIGEAPEIISLISTLQSAYETNPDLMLYELLHDIKQFIRQFQSVIDNTPLQLYSSAIVFAPEKSVIRRHFQPLITRLLRTAPAMLENWTNTLQVLGGHGDSVYSVAFSPDGKQLVSTSQDKTVRLWDAATGKALEMFEGHTAEVHSATFSHDGSQLVSVSSDASVRLWNTGLGTTLRSLEGHTDNVSSIAFSPDGKHIASASVQIRIWDAETGEMVRILNGHTRETVRLVYSPDSKKIASSSWYDRTVRIWDATTGEALHVIDNIRTQYASIDFSPDGKHIAVGTSKGDIIMLDAVTGKVLSHRLSASSRVFDNHVNALAFSPCGTKLAAESKKGAVVLWNLETKSEILEIKNRSSFVNYISFSPDGKRVAMASYGHVQIHDAETGREFRVLHDPTYYSYCPCDVVFSPDGSLLAHGGDSKDISVWNVETGKIRKTLSGHSSSLRSLAFSPDGRQLASASKDASIRVWDVEAETTLMRLEAHRSAVYSAAFSSDDKRLATTSSDNTVKLWDSKTGALLKVFQGHDKPVNSVVFCSDDKELLSASADSTIRRWSTATGEMLQELKGHEGPILSVALSSDSRKLGSGSIDDTIKLWDVITGEVIRTLEGHCGSVNCVDFSAGGMLLASASSDETVRLWDVETGVMLHILEIKCVANGVAFSPDGRQLAAASWDRKIRLWDVGTLARHGSPVTSVLFSPGGKLLASIRDDKTIRLIDTTTRAELRTLAGHHGSINSVAFSSGAKHLASASDDETVKLWDLATGTVLQTFTGHENWVRSVAFSPDDRHLASASWDKTIRLWDLATGKLLRTLEGHRDWVCVVVFSADGSLLASGSDDGTARVWDANTGAPLHTLEGHTDWVRFAAFSPDSHQVVSASNDKTVRRWDTATGAELHVEAVSWMAFSANGKHLETNMGPYYLQTMATASSQQQIHIRGDWIYRGTERLLWLPQDYAATCSACSGDNLLALGHGSGWVSFLEFESLQSQV